MTSTLIHDLVNWLDASPDDVALITSTQSLTVSDVADRVSALAGALRARKVRPGTLVAVSSDGVGECIGMCAVQAVNAVSVITPSEMEWQQSGATVLVHEHRAWASDTSIDIAAQSASNWDGWRFENDVDNDQVVHACLTSGTTGKPKIVEFSRVIADRRTDRYIKAWPIQSAVSLFRLSAIAGYNAAIAAVRQREPYVVITSFDRPSAELLATGHFTHLSGAPNQVVQVIRAVRDAGLTVTFETIRTAGAPQTEQFRKAAEEVCTGVVSNLYGATECGAAALSTDIAAVAFRGVPMLGTEFEVVDSSGAPVTAGIEGDIRYRTPAQCLYYRGDGERQTVADEAGWFYPGDRGFIDTDGCINVIGRIGDVINISGVKINPLQIEADIEALDGINDAACVPVTFPDGLTHLVLAIVIKDKSAYDAAVANVAARPQAGRPNMVLDIPEIPRNRNGKIDRALLAEKLTSAIRIEPTS
jgi:fatty-acyl-CoA synthase